VESVIEDLIGVQSFIGLLQFSLLSCSCEKLVAEARGQLGNGEEEERPPLEAAIMQRLVESVTD
jgi:hypothetical protein